MAFFSAYSLLMINFFRLARLKFTSSIFNTTREITVKYTELVC